MATIFLDEIAGAYIIPGYTSYKYKRREGQLVSVTDNYNVDEYLINTDTYLEIDSFFGTTANFVGKMNTEQYMTLNIRCLRRKYAILNDNMHKTLCVYCLDSFY